MTVMPLRDSWFLTGPTASGKSAVGVELARRIDAEIVSLDSMTLYRRLDIGTAKPTPQERRSGRQQRRSRAAREEDLYDHRRGARRLASR